MMTIVPTALLAVTSPVFTTAKIDRLLAEVRRTNGPELESIEKVLKVRLPETDRNTSFTIHRGRTAHGQSVEMRTEIPGSDATAGALLIIDDLGGCIRVDELRSRYGTLRLTQSPSGHSLDQIVGWTIDRPWGEVTFGFNERISDCLSGLALSATNHKPGR